jgi:hypothetical protein
MNKWGYVIFIHKGGLMQKESNTNGKYKDRLFNFIFGSEENREWTLSLYNAINGSHYTDASLIQFNTLKDVLYLEMVNDTSFLISGTVNLYEHQSTYNPNMPLRFLEYLGKLYSGYIKDNRLNKYGSKRINLPTPKLVVFYNGIDGIEDEKTLRLSDSYIKPCTGDPDVEIKVQMLNVNYGKNKKIMDSCKPLFEYSWFIDKIRENQKLGMELTEAVDMAVNYMPKDYVIKSFIVKNQAEVIGMLDTEYNEAEVRELFMEDGRAEERVNTAREKARADEEKQRADLAEKEIEKLKAEVARLKAQAN